MVGGIQWTGIEISETRVTVTSAFTDSICNAFLVQISGHRDRTIDYKLSLRNNVYFGEIWV